MSDRQGVLELSYNYDVKATHNGNTDPKGFGYISISVDYLTAACQRLSDAGFQSLQSPTKGSAIVLDPDAYWIKISAMPSADNTANSQSSTITKTCPKSYKFRSTMLRIKNKDISLKFYTEVMGMKHVDTTEHQEDGFTSYFLSYNGTESDASLANEGSSAAKHEEMLELAWYYETEKIPDMRYHSGNTSPEGFGHICVSVDDITAACERFEHLGVSWQKRLMDGPFRIGFIFDPDGYVSSSFTFFTLARELPLRECQTDRFTVH